MKSLVYNVYRGGSAGLSNLVMSFELGIVLARLTDRVLILKGNTTPVANVVQYGDAMRNSYPSRITDIYDLGVPWINSEQVNLAAYAPQEICDKPAWDCVFYFPSFLSSASDDIGSFAGRRSTFVTIGDDLEHVPALSFSGGPGSDTLSFYSYFFYLDHSSQLLAHDALRQFKPKIEMTDFADRVASDLGSFNAVHIRRGDFKHTIGVTTRDRTPAQALEALDNHFDRKDRLVILTDEADDPFFHEIRTAYPDFVFLDQHILTEYGSDFFDLPAHDSISLACLSQLVAAESRDFIGTMTSTFTSLIQRKRGNRGKDERFKFLWNELPEPDDVLEPGRHAFSDSVPLDKGIMVEQYEGPYSWNRYNERFNPAWMREWPESFLTSRNAAELTRTRLTGHPKQAISEAVGSEAQNIECRNCSVSFLDARVDVYSDIEPVSDAMRKLFTSMNSPTGTEAISDLRVENDGTGAKLLVDGKVVGSNTNISGFLRTVYREIVRRFIDRYPELVWMHAGCAASDGGAVVLPGAWGRGKSTIVMQLYELGWSYLSDDISPLDPVSASVIPFPGTPQMRVPATTEIARDKLGSIPKTAITLDPDKVARGPEQVSMVVFPHYARSAPATLTPVPPAQAVGQLLENCLSFAKNEDETIYRLCAIVEALPVFGLRFGDAAEAAELLIGARNRLQSAAPQNE